MSWITLRTLTNQAQETTLTPPAADAFVPISRDAHPSIEIDYGFLTFGGTVPATDVSLVFWKMSDGLASVFAVVRYAAGTSAGHGGAHSVSTQRIPGQSSRRPASQEAPNLANSPRSRDAPWRSPRRTCPDNVIPYVRPHARRA